MEIALLIVGILTFIAAVAAAVFGYPAWRAVRNRPKLVLEATRNEQNNIGDGRRQVTIEITLHNEGTGDAEGWKAIIESSPPRILAWEMPRAPGITDGETDDGVWIEWQSTGADDSIGPDLSRRTTLPSSHFLPSEEPRARFTITAGRMEPVRGEIVIAWPEGEQFARVEVV